MLRFTLMDTRNYDYKTVVQVFFTFYTQVYYDTIVNGNQWGVKWVQVATAPRDPKQTRVKRLYPSDFLVILADNCIAM